VKSPLEYVNDSQGIDALKVGVLLRDWLAYLVSVFYGVIVQQHPLPPVERENAIIRKERVGNSRIQTKK
jgi:hypothetical protein